MKGTNIAVVDDDEAVGRSLFEILETYGFSGTHFRGGAEFLAGCAASHFECVVLDVRMPGMDGLEVQRRLRDAKVDVPLIFITGHGDIPLAVRAMRAGAHDFLEKPINDEVLVESIRRAIGGGGEKGRYGDASRKQFSDGLKGLSRREREVMDLVVAGYSSSAIGSLLSISSRTVDHHRAHILEKMQMPSIAALIRVAVQYGSVDR